MVAFDDATAIDCGKIDLDFRLANFPTSLDTAKCHRERIKLAMA
jgi:hypothetical protein